MAEFLIKLFDFLKETVSGKVVLALVLISMIYGFTKCSFYRENFQVPRCNLVHIGEQDMVKSDIKLATMSIVVTPLIAIKHENKVVDAVKVTNYYDKNYASYDDSNENISNCILDVSEEQQVKIEVLSKEIKKLLEENFNEDNEFENFDVYIAYLVYVTWQNEKSNILHHGYWYFTDEMERHITRAEVEKWNEKLKNEIDLDDYEEDGFIYNNEQMIQIIEYCADTIFEQE